MGKHSKNKSAELQQKLAILPESPGVYTYYDAEGTVISLESTGAEICERVASGLFAHGGGAEETETLWGGDGREPVSVHLTALSIEYEDGSIYTFTDDQLAAVLEP